MQVGWEDSLLQQGPYAGRGPRAECGIQGHEWLQGCGVEKGGWAEGSGGGERGPEGGCWACLCGEGGLSTCPHWPGRRQWRGGREG